LEKCETIAMDEVEIDIGSPQKVSESLSIIDFNESFEAYTASFTDVVVQ
jgi:hypothetical protein